MMRMARVMRVLCAAYDALASASNRALPDLSRDALRRAARTSAQHFIQNLCAITHKRLEVIVEMLSIGGQFCDSSMHRLVVKRRGWPLPRFR